MSTLPTKQELLSLVESMCEVQDRMLGARGMPEHIQRPHMDNMEALKAPVFFLWELLGYGTPREFSEKGIRRVWMASLDLRRGNTRKSVYRCSETTRCPYQNTTEGQG